MSVNKSSAHVLHGGEFIVHKGECKTCRSFHTCKKNFPHIKIDGEHWCAGYASEPKREWRIA